MSITGAQMFKNEVRWPQLYRTSTNILSDQELSTSTANWAWALGCTVSRTAAGGYSAHSSQLTFAISWSSYMCYRYIPSRAPWWPARHAGCMHVHILKVRRQVPQIPLLADTVHSRYWFTYLLTISTIWLRQPMSFYLKNNCAKISSGSGLKRRSLRLFWRRWSQQQEQNKSRAVAGKPREAV